MSLTKSRDTYYIPLYIAGSAIPWTTAMEWNSMNEREREGEREKQRDLNTRLCLVYIAEMRSPLVRYMDYPILWILIPQSEDLIVIHSNQNG